MRPAAWCALAAAGALLAAAQLGGEAGAQETLSKLARNPGQPCHQLAARLHRLDGGLANFNDVALIHSLRQIHRAHAGLVTVI